MAPVPLSLNDARIHYKFSTIADGITYHYMLFSPEVNATATVILLHGGPDLGMGWRYQVPHLLSLNLQVIVFDLLGYGKTSVPQSSEEYTMKKMSAHIAHIVQEVTDELVIVGGHDWGAFLAWRTAMYHRDLVRGVFAFSVPYMPPLRVVLTLNQIVQKAPAFKYQQQMASGEAEAIVPKTPASLRGFFNRLLGGLTPDGLPGFDPMVGFIQSRIEDIQPSPLVAPDILDFYGKDVANIQSTIQPTRLKNQRTYASVS